MSLTDQLLATLDIRWKTDFSIEPFGDRISTKSFVSEVIQYLVILNNLRTVHGNKLTIGLMANNSLNYIACYTALIFSQMNFYLIPNKLRKSFKESIIAQSGINFMFVDDTPIELLKNIQWFKGAMDINSFKYIYLRDRLSLIKQEEIDKSMYDFYMTVGRNQGKSFLREFTDEYFIRNESRKMYIFPSNTDKVYPVAICFYDKDILNGLDKLTASNLLPSLEGEIFYSEIDFSYAPVYSILWPMVNGAIFTKLNSKSHIVLQSSDMFKNYWDDVVNEVYQMRFIGKWLMESWLYWLFKLIVRWKLKRRLNEECKKKAIVILNAILPPRVLETVVRKLPIYTTYGMQECNHILAVNNYSTKEHCKESCVGELLTEVGASIFKEYNDEGSLMIVSTALSSDIERTEGWYNTRDHATIQSTTSTALIFVYGKMRYVIRSSVYAGSNLENIERIMKNVPYFKDVFIYQSADEKYHMMIYPNIDISSTTNYGLLDLTKMIKPYNTLINQRYGIEFISDVALSYYDFIRSHTGKILKGAYFAQVFGVDAIEP
jgi:long-subunit acyl-CoA synthetase (AMP-forming)